MSIERLRRVMFAPATTTMRGLDTEVELDPESEPVDQQCVLNLDSVDNAGIDSMVRRLGVLGAHKMAEVCRALEIAVDCG